MGNKVVVPNKMTKYEAAFMFTDEIFEIDSLIDIKEGWKYIKNQKYIPPQAQYQDYTISVFSLNSNLKAHFINKICGHPSIPIDLNRADKIKGIKIRYSKPDLLNNMKKFKKDKNPVKSLKRFAFLTGSGKMDPIFFHENDYMISFLKKKESLDENNINNPEVQFTAAKFEQISKEIINDKKYSSIFIDDFLLEVGEIIIILVSDITFQEQKYINDLTLRYKRKKKIFVLHLFNDTTLVALRLKIDREIKSLFLVKEIYMDLSKLYKKNIDLLPINKSVFVEQDVNEPISFLNPDERDLVVHMAFGKENSEAGKFYNEVNYKYLMNSLIKNGSFTERFEIDKKFKSFLNTFHHNYFEFVNKKDDAKIEIDVKLLDRKGEIFLTPIIDHPIKLNYLKKIEYDILDKPITIEANTNLKYQLLEKSDQIEIQIDIVSLLIETLSIQIISDSSNVQYLELYGQKFNFLQNEPNYRDEFIQENGNAYFGKFHLRIPTVSNLIRLKKKTEAFYQNGSLFIILFKSKKSEIDVSLRKEKSHINIFGESEIRGEKKDKKNIFGENDAYNFPKKKSVEDLE